MSDFDSFFNGNKEAQEEFKKKLKNKTDNFNKHSWCLSTEDRCAKEHEIYCKTHSKIQKKYCGHGSY